MKPTLYRISRMRYEENQRVPWWLGVAWYDYAQNVMVCLPLPLNILAGLLRHVWLWSRWPWRISMTAGERACYERGRHDGERTIDVLRAAP